VGTLNYSAAMSHAPGITAFPDAPPMDQRRLVLSAIDEARAALEEARLDALVVIAPDHFTNFFVDNMPAFCVGLSESYVGPAEDWLGIDKRTVPGAQALARDILGTCFASGLEPAFSRKLRLEHSVMVPLSLLTPKMDIPIVWIMINCQVPPLPSLRRCFELGSAIRRVFDRRDGRFGILGTGGLSHWPGAPEGGDIDAVFDHEFLAMLEKGDPELVLALANERIDRAGFGAWEIRQWCTVLGAALERRGRTLAYAAVREWETGCAVTLFDRRGDA